MYITAPQVNLRDRLAPIYEKKGVVHSGDKVYVLERKRRFLRVRDASGNEGWIEERNTISGTTYDQFVALNRDTAKAAAQAHGVARNAINLHLTPGRDAEHLYQVKQGDKLDILKRATAEKPGVAAAPVVESTSMKKTMSAPGPILEDWWLVRDAEQHGGWVLARMVDIDAPMDVAQYAEGQRIVAYFVLNQVRDGEKSVPQYLVLMTENKDGLPFDYNQARVFTWNVKRHRYETAYRERNLNGVFPVKVGSADFGKDGTLPTFTLTVMGNESQPIEREYRMQGVIVKRVLTQDQTSPPVTSVPAAKKPA